MRAVFRAQATPCGQNCSLPPASTISSTSSPTVSRAVDQMLIQLAAHAAKRPPAHLDGAESASHLLAQLVGQHRRIVEENRSVRLDAIAIDAAEQPRDWLIYGLAQQVPQRDIDAADRVLHRAAAAKPEHGL